MAGYRAHATKDLIAFLDSDDLWERNFLEVTVGYLGNNPDVALVSTGWRTLPSGRRWPPIKEPLLEGNLLPRLLKTRIVRTSAAVARKTALLEAGLFDETLEVAEDLDMWLRLAGGYPTAFLNTHLSWGRRHDDRLSKNRRLHIERQLQVLAAHYDPAFVAKSAFDRRCAALYVDLGQSYFKAHDLLGAKACYKHALALNPFSLRARRYLVKILFARRQEKKHS
jgi:tetratricopeptide (TPR) repeat protein